jgi:hypothetical protein
MSRRERPTLLPPPSPLEGRKGGDHWREWGCGHRVELMSAGVCGTKNARRNEGYTPGERESGPAASHHQRPHDGSHI